MIRNVVVCGAGTMGYGIAQVTAQHELPTILFDISTAALENASAAIEQQLNKLVAKGKITSDKKNTVTRLLTFTDDISSCTGDLVIEAVAEKESVKVSLFNQLAKYNSASTIFATNTSSLSVSSIAAQTDAVERICGLHFFNPAPVMQLIEVVRGEKTLQHIIDELVNFSIEMGKTPVVCNDSPGFIVNRVARHYYLEPLKMAESNCCPIEVFDELLESCGFKMGPFRLMDLIGNDVNFAVTQSLYDAFGQPIRFKPSSLQQKKVEHGELGRKTNKGYYEY